MRHAEHTYLLESKEATVSRLRRAALALVYGERILLIDKLVPRALAFATHLLDVGFVVVDLGLELLLRVC